MSTTGLVEILGVCAMNANECQRYSWHGQTEPTKFLYIEIGEANEMCQKCVAFLSMKYRVLVSGVA